MKIPDLSSDETSKGGSHDGAFRRHLGEAAGEEVDVLDVVLVGFTESLDRPRTHDVVKVSPGLDLGQAAEFSPLAVT
jgi:hypothetical protein